MKKIYMILAAITLLSMSLNAQMMAKKQVALAQLPAPTEKIINFPISFHAAFPNITSRPWNAPLRATYTLLNDDIDGSKYSTGSDIDNQLSAPWSATYLRNQSGYVLYIRANGSMTFTVPSGYNNADFKFEFKTSTSYYNGYFDFTPSTGSAQRVNTSAASTVYDCELTGLSTGNTVTITGKYSSASYSPDFMYMYVYVSQTTPTITASPSSLNLTSAPNESATETVTVSGANLSSGITATISGTDASLFSVSPASLGTSGGSLTVTYSPTALGNHTATLTLSSSGAQDVTITLNGTCSNEKNLTVCDGQYYAEVLPVFGYFYDEPEHNQMVYSSTLLGTEMAGRAITSMTFYPTTGWFDADEDDVQDDGEIYTGINFSGGSVTFKLMNLSSGTSAFAQQNPTLITGTMTPVATVTPSANTSATTWVITFDQPFEYTGGDLLIDVTSTAGTYSPSFFTVDAVDDYRGAYNVSYNGTNYSYGANFLPKVTFTYELPSGPQHDLAIALDAPTSIGATQTATVTATVTNNGDFDEASYTVTIYANGSAISTQNVTQTLVIGDSRTFTVNYPTTENEGGTTVNFSATVTCTDDAFAANNQATASMSVVTLPPPENVAASVDGLNATVTWDPPILPSTQQNLSWDFESQSQFNEWTLVSIDNDSYNWTYNTYVNGTSASVFEPHSGTGYIVSPSYVNNVGALHPDNWLISPEVTLGGTFTFWAKGTDNTYYAENFGVFVYEGSYSSGTTGFVQVDVDKTATAGWVKYTFDLSQYSGQGRIAIRHYDCTDQYWLEVDDIEYQVMVSSQQPTSYNVYLDGVLVGNVDANDPLTYDFNNLAIDEHTVEISAVYPLGESALIPVQFTITPPLPVLTEPTDGSTVNVGTNTGAGTSTTITVSGENLTGNLTISVSGNGFSVEPTTISAADANNGTTITVTYDGYNANATGTLTITSSNGEVETVTVDLTASFEAQPIEPVTGLLRLHMLLCDQLKADIPDDNTHADTYRYVLKYEPQGGETKQSNNVDVDIQKTACEVKGYYTKAQIDGDTDGSLTMGVLTADVQFNLSGDNDEIEFYDLQGAANRYPTLGQDYLTKLQRQTNFTYKEMLETSPNKDQVYNNGEHHYYDDSEPILTGTYSSGYMSYAPLLSTWGIQRRYYEDDGLDNTYGAPVWRTRVGDVQIQGTPQLERQVKSASDNSPNPYTSWTVDNTVYNLYFMGLNAHGLLPSTEGDYGTNIKYEPYMFRVFVASPTGKLRKFTREVGEGGGYYAVDAGPIAANEKYCVGSYLVNDGWDAENMVFRKTIDGSKAFDPNAWDDILKFGAVDGITKDDIKVYVRFYYMVEGWNATRDGEARPGNGAEASGDPDDPSTFIYELVSNAEIVGVTYVNAQGMQSDKPFDGLNIVITKFSDGTTMTTKVMR